jgi:dTDP-4-dehydrorhamnose 3,5-epimerase
MELITLGIEGLWLIESKVWNDDRGFFREWFKFEEIRSRTGINFEVKQANHSQSRKGVVRGIHYSLAKDGQAKLVTCASGSFMDVVVDLRPESPTFKSHKTINLSGGDGKSILIGPGLGHGFIALEENSEIIYLMNSPYVSSDEHGINPFDIELGISWTDSGCKKNEFILSRKDEIAPNFLEQFREGNLPR